MGIMQPACRAATGPAAKTIRAPESQDWPCPGQEATACDGAAKASDRAALATLAPTRERC
jgi:hypothetical protein